MEKKLLDKTYLKLNRMHHDLVLMCYSTLGDTINKDLKEVRDKVKLILEELKEEIENS